MCLPIRSAPQILAQRLCVMSEPVRELLSISPAAKGFARCWYHAGRGLLSGVAWGCGCIPEHNDGVLGNACAAYALIVGVDADWAAGYGAVGWEARAGQ